jgi:predicted DsbA family dithiol-disulfide isomerase
MAAHRLMRFASRVRREEPLADRLFAAYFENGEDIGAIDTLVTLAAEAGLEPKATRAFLAGTEEADWVSSVDALGHQSGIAGVPYFIFDRRYALAGAQEPASFLPLFDALIAASDDLMASSAE